MYNSYNPKANSVEDIIAVFKTSLISENISSGSIRSYLSDTRHFLGWLTFFLESNKIISSPVIPTARAESEEAEESLSFLRGKGIPPCASLSRDDGKIRENQSTIRVNQPSIRVNQANALLKHVNQKVLEAYKEYLTSNNVPLKTINRRLSSLRSFGKFCQAQNWMTENYFDTLRNISKPTEFPENKWHLGEFRVNLWKNNASKATLKNYLNDIKQFIAWHERQIAK